MLEDRIGHGLFDLAIKRLSVLSECFYSHLGLFSKDSLIVVIEIDL